MAFGRSSGASDESKPVEELTDAELQARARQEHGKDGTVSPEVEAEATRRLGEDGYFFSSVVLPIALFATAAAGLHLRGI